MPFEIFKGKTNKKFYFRLKAKNQQVILSSEGYNQKSGAKNGVKSVGKHAGKTDNFEVRKAKDGRKYFVLKASNGEIIGKSQMYKSDSGLRNGMKSVATNAKGDSKDLT